jgi:hypothetical protein
MVRLLTNSPKQKFALSLMSDCTTTVPAFTCKIRPGGARSYSRPKALRWTNSPPLWRRAGDVDRIGAGAVRLCPTRYPPKAQAERLAMAPSKFVKSRSPRTG